MNSASAMGAAGHPRGHFGNPNCIGNPILARKSPWGASKNLSARTLGKITSS